MTNTISEEQIKNLTDAFGEKIKETLLDSYDRFYVKVEKEDVKNIAEYIHDQLGFTHANFNMGTDLGESIEVTWYVGHPDLSTILVLKTSLDRDNPEVSSLRYLWEGMNWHERETYGMLGVVFIDHGDLRRLILPDLWDGYPLRNDYIYTKPSYRKPEDELMS